VTQSQRVLEYIRAYGSITPLEAMRDLGCYRLAARIHDLKAEGHDIESDSVSVRTRTGSTTMVARYRIKPAPERLSVCRSLPCAPDDGGGPTLF